MAVDCISHLIDYNRAQAVSFWDIEKSLNEFFPNAYKLTSYLNFVVKSVEDFSLLSFLTYLFVIVGEYHIVRFETWNQPTFYLCAEVTLLPIFIK